MRYSIVTPTICRPSLLRLCESVNRQTQTDWEHLVVIDLPAGEMTQSQREVIGSVPENVNRAFSHCEKRHRNYGHTCRHQIWSHVKGEYVLYVDDDDYLADDDTLRTLDAVTQEWAVFSMVRHGKKWLRLPPGTGKTSTGGFIHRKAIGRWPDLDSYEADGSFVEELARRHPYQVLDSRPLIVQPQSSCGVSNANTSVGRMRAKIVSYRLRLRHSYNI